MMSSYDALQSIGLFITCTCIHVRTRGQPNTLLRPLIIQCACAYKEKSLSWLRIIQLIPFEFFILYVRRDSRKVPISRKFVVSGFDLHGLHCIYIHGRPDSLDNYAWVVYINRLSLTRMSGLTVRIDMQACMRVHTRTVYRPA